ncbi:hypothetical protein FA13DRAFT_1618602 [Coprinellus micaceus]|uniref:Uncharacterized protein n=1 Tax=Coprinellus micaceus TaxID=71717 RepID=A0A4Y7U329_COPMI|nr:hypothetical protein FA13DRAFT_1647270 [Coprinellus micaceus]TEB40249.1 hypothetical protein FA13DRAFT_1618602 [Coprinellus micaceus]
MGSPAETVSIHRILAELSTVLTPPTSHSVRTDPLVGHGRHFGRTIRTFCRIHTLITNGLSRAMQIELGRITVHDLGHSEIAEQRLYSSLLKLSPGLEERLNTGSDQDSHYVADMITKGIASARSDDTKSLKSVVVDWITPTNRVLSPPIQRNVKDNRGFHHPRTGELLCPVNFDWNDEKIRRDLAGGHLIPSGDLWPRFIYRYFEYNPQDPWDGLLRSSLLVKAFKHVFTSPSSVHGGASKATRSSNARIHGMTTVTISSLAYIATQVRFALSDSPAFCRTDLITDSEYFYNLVVELLEDENEWVEVDDLLKWWNQQIFPAQVQHNRSVHGESVIAKIKERRALINSGHWNAGSASASTGSGRSATPAAESGPQQG